MPVYLAYGASGATNADVKNYIQNSGGVGIVDYRGHGFNKCWSSWNLVSEDFTVTDVYSLNNSTWLPIVYNICCSSGNITAPFEVLVEAWLRHSSGGGVGALAASRPSATDENHTFDKKLFEATFTQSIFNVGQAVNYAKNSIIPLGYDGLTNARMYYWIGEPELQIWTNTPATMVVNHPTSMPTGTSSFTVTVQSGGSALQDAVVCLWKDTEVFVAGYTDANGVATFSISPSTGGTIYVTVTKHNYEPYEGECSITNITVQNKFIDAGNMTNYGTVGVDGTNYNSPYSTLWAVGSSHTISANASYNYNGATHYFCSWSDGGAQSHSVTVIVPTTYTAYYKKRPTLSGYYDGPYVHLSWNWPSSSRPPGFQKFEVCCYDVIPHQWIDCDGANSWSGQVDIGKGKRFYVRALVNVAGTINYHYSDLLLVTPGSTGDPIIAYSTDSLATSFPNGKKIAVASEGKTHVVFTSNDSVYYCYSEDKDLKEWSQPVSLGDGKYPAIALDGSDNPNVCFVRGRGLNFVRIASAIPPAQNFYQAPAKVLEIGSPSFVINPKTNEAYLGWTEAGSDFSASQIASFNVTSPPLALAPTPIDQGGAEEIKSPSLALSPAGNLLATWSKAGKVYYNDSESGTIQLSAETANAIHPIVDAYGDRTSVVWVEETSPGSFEIMRKTRQASVWCDVENISGGFTGKAEFPTIVGTSQILWAENFGNYAIRYSGIYDDGWLVYSGLLSNPNKANARFVSAAFRQTWPQSYITTVNVKNYLAKAATGSFAIFAVKMPIAPVAYFYVDAGKPESSIYNMQREGDKTYGYQPEYTIDYHPTRLIYQFAGLNPSKRYRIKVVYYHEGDREWRERLDVDNILHENSRIPPKTKIEVEKWLPHACYKDGQIEVHMSKIKGDYAICSVIALYEYEKKRGREEEPAGAAMTADAVIGHQPLVFSLSQNYPNPFSQSSAISYQLPVSAHITLKIYNIAGQLVKTLVNEYKSPGVYSVKWDGKDRDGEAVANGVYFYRLTSGDFTATRKMTIIR
ncbi:MAG: C25 family cysteine peptidase [Candidatus Edwardsbacteria bacterium]